MISFQKLRWRNFLSTGNDFTELSLDSHYTTLVIGKNGAGKSSFCDALTFALFGKPYRSINKPQLLNSITKKNLLVEVEFSVAGRSYLVRRGIKPNLFEIVCDGELIDQAAQSRDYQELLEKQILKINYKSFCQIVILGNASFIPFMQLPALQRRTIIEDILDLQIFSTMNEVLKDQIKENNAAIKDCDREIDTIETKLKFVREQLRENQNKSKEFVQSKRALIVSLNDKIQEATDEKTRLQNEIETLKESLVDKAPLEKRIEKLVNLRAQLRATIKTLSDDISFFEKNDVCPSCAQNIEHTFKCSVIETKTTSSKEVQEGLEKLAQTHKETTEKLNAILELQSKIDSVRLLIMPISSGINHWYDQISAIEKEIAEATGKVDTSEEKVIDFEKELTSAKDKYNVLQDDKQIYAAAALLLKDGGIKTKIINQYIPIINKTVNKFLAAMNFYVDFQFNPQFEETLKSRHRDEFSYSSFSEGEKQRLNLAILFTWRVIAKMRNSSSSNLLIMDEVLDSSMDTDGTDDFLKILMALSSDTNSIIISHRTENIMDKFDRIVTFEKYKNFSRIGENANG